MALGSSIKLANLWRVVRELDLQSIRAQSMQPFDLAIVGDDADTAAQLRRALGPAGRPPHPWIRLVAAADAVHGATVPDAAIVLSSTLPLEPGLSNLVVHWQRSRVPIVVAHVAPAPAAASSAPPPNMTGYVMVAGVSAGGAAAIATALVDLLPEERRLSFAHQLPPFRPPVFEIVIEETARANATYALTTGLAEVVPLLTAPLNLGDMIVLTKNQLLMSYRLVLAAGRDGEPRRLMTEILGVLGGGMIFRQAARQLIGLIPIVGLIPKVAIAYGGTWAIGRAVVLWVTEGRTVTLETVRALSAEGLDRGRQLARELVTRAAASRAATGGRWARIKAYVPGLTRRSPPGPRG